MASIEPGFREIKRSGVGLTVNKKKWCGSQPGELDLALLGLERSVCGMPQASLQGQRNHWGVQLQVCDLQEQVRI